MGSACCESKAKEDPFDDRTDASDKREEGNRIKKGLVPLTSEFEKGVYKAINLLRTSP